MPSIQARAKKLNSMKSQFHLIKPLQWLTEVKELTVCVCVCVCACMCVYVHVCVLCIPISGAGNMIHWLMGMPYMCAIGM